MQTIPIETVEEVWKGLDALDDEGIRKLIKKLEKSQPLILAYLGTRGEEFLQGDEVGDLIFLGAVVWRCFEQISEDLNGALTPELLERVEKRTFKAMEEAESHEEEAAVDMALKAAQQPLLQTVLGYLVEGGSEIHPDRQGIAFFLIKIVVDCLDGQEAS